MILMGVCSTVLILRKGWTCSVEPSHFSQKSKSAQTAHLYLIPSMSYHPHPSQVIPLCLFPFFSSSLSIFPSFGLTSSFCLTSSKMGTNSPWGAFLGASSSSIMRGWFLSQILDLSETSSSIQVFTLATSPGRSFFNFSSIRLSSTMTLDSSGLTSQTWTDSIGSASMCSVSLLIWVGSSAARTTLIFMVFCSDDVRMAKSCSSLRVMSSPSSSMQNITKDSDCSLQA